VIRSRVVEVYGQLDQPEPERTGVEIEIALRLAGDRGDMMNSHSSSCLLGQRGPGASGGLSNSLGDLIQVRER
jgi:hypothetical protein